MDYPCDELRKKLEVSISKNATIILQKPIFRGEYPLRGFGSRRDLRIRVAWVVLDLCAKFQPPSSILASSTHCLSLVKKICQYPPPPSILVCNIGLDMFIENRK